MSVPRSAAMVKGATQTESGHGLEIERQYLDQYLAQHYVDAGSLDLTSSNYSIGGSVTLEYAIDDFSIAQMALAQGDHSLYESMMQRAHNWQYLFNPATGYVQARNPNGSFPRRCLRSSPRCSSPEESSGSRRAMPSSTPGRCLRTWLPCPPSWAGTCRR